MCEGEGGGGNASSLRRLAVQARCAVAAPSPCRRLAAALPRRRSQCPAPSTYLDVKRVYPSISLHDSEGRDGVVVRGVVGQQMTMPLNLQSAVARVLIPKNLEHPHPLILHLLRQINTLNNRATHFPPP